MYGAPFLDMDLMYRELSMRIGTEEFAFRRRAFTPVSGKYAGEVCFGLEFQPLSPGGDFLPVALTMLKIICDCYPEQIVFKKEEAETDGVHLAVLYGNHEAEEYLCGKVSLARLRESWSEEGRAFREAVKEFGLYGGGQKKPAV